MLKRLAILVLSGLSLSIGINAYGVEHTEESYDRQLSYSVSPVHPTTHQGKQSDLYFDLKLAPNEETTVYMKITNDGLEEEKFRIKINQATTTKQGDINYQGESSGLHSSLKYSIDDYVNYEDTVIVPAKESVNHPIKVRSPKEVFNGIILAGIFVELDNQEENSNSNGVLTTTGYSFALMISQNDNEESSLIEMDSVYPEASFGAVNIIAKLFNPVMKGYGGLTYHAVVTRNDKEFIDEKYTDKEFAPNSFCEFIIAGDDKPLLAGDYKLNLSIADKRENIWNFEETFTVTKQEAKEMNSIALTETKRNTTAVAIICIILLLFIASIIFLKKHKEKRRY